VAASIKAHMPHTNVGVPQSRRDDPKRELEAVRTSSDGASDEMSRIIELQPSVVQVAKCATAALPLEITPDSKYVPEKGKVFGFNCRNPPAAMLGTPGRAVVRPLQLCHRAALDGFFHRP
jgi:hypothetical protein